MNIALAAFGKRGYFFAAYNLAFTIKHYNPKANILLIHDKGLSALPQHELNVFDKLHAIDEALTHPRGMFDAGFVKLNTYKIATKYFRKYMFLDVDAIPLKDITPWYEQAEAHEKDFITDVRGSGTIEDNINYSVWASNENIYTEFELEPTDIWRAVQSSWHFAKRTKENTEMFKDAIKLNFQTFTDRRMLEIKWGKCLPDELVLGGAIARRKLDPSFDYEPIFFPNRHLRISEMREKYYLLSMFGNGIGNTLVKADYKEFYDRYLLKEIFKPKGINLKYKNSMIMRDKMIN